MLLLLITGSQFSQTANWICRNRVYIVISSSRPLFFFLCYVVILACMCSLLLSFALKFFVYLFVFFPCCLFYLEYSSHISTCTNPGLISNVVSSKKPLWISPMHWNLQASREQRKFLFSIFQSSILSPISRKIHKSDQILGVLLDNFC